jgi:protease-4
MFRPLPHCPAGPVGARCRPRDAAASAAAARAQPPGWERDVLEKLVFASLNEQRARRWRCSGALPG